MANSRQKSFLKPISVAILAILSSAGLSNATIAQNKSNFTENPEITLSNKGQELLPAPLVIKPSNEAILEARHRSHYSHRSHSSHRSHYSSR